MKSVLVDFIKNFIDALLRKVGSFCVRFSFTFIKQFFFCFFLWLIRIEKIIDPIKKTIDTYTPIETPPHRKDKKKTSEATGKMRNMSTCIAYRNKRQVYDKINSSEYPQGNAAIEHWKDAITRCQHSCGHYDSHNTC